MQKSNTVIQLLIRIRMISCTIILTLLIMGACGVRPNTNPDDILQTFRAAGLEATNPTRMSAKDYGIAPLLCQAGARRFLIPSMGDAMGGRIFVCETVQDAKQLKDYYDQWGRTSAVLYSWTYQHENVLLQINGALDETQAKRYGQIIAELP